MNKTPPSTSTPTPAPQGPGPGSGQADLERRLLLDLAAVERLANPASQPIAPSLAEVSSFTELPPLVAGLSRSLTPEPETDPQGSAPPDLSPTTGPAQSVWADPSGKHSHEADQAFSKLAPLIASADDLVSVPARSPLPSPADSSPDSESGPLPDQSRETFESGLHLDLEAELARLPDIARSGLETAFPQGLTKLQPESSSLDPGYRFNPADDLDPAVEAALARLPSEGKTLVDPMGVFPEISATAGKSLPTSASASAQNPSQSRRSQHRRLEHGWGRRAVGHNRR